MIHVYVVMKDISSMKIYTMTYDVCLHHNRPDNHTNPNMYAFLFSLIMLLSIHPLNQMNVSFGATQGRRAIFLRTEYILNNLHVDGRALCSMVQHLGGVGIGNSNSFQCYVRKYLIPTNL